MSGRREAAREQFASFGKTAWLARAGGRLRAHRPSVRSLAAAIRERKLTYLPMRKLRRLAQAMDMAARAPAGCYIEAGVALGGAAILIAGLKPDDATLKLYDVFGMIPPPAEADGEDVHARYEVIRAGRASGIGGDPYYGYMPDLESVVRGNLESFDVDLAARRVEIHKGRFEDALTIAEPVRFAHVDCDWRDSVAVCIERIWPRLVVGGVMVFDDYHDYSGCRLAVNEWLARSPRLEILFGRPSLAVRKIA